MNTLVKKEIRLLLPSFVIGLGLAFSIFLLPKNFQSNFWQFLIVLPMIACPAMVVMMSLDSFGRELGTGTLASLLVQPVPRGRIWWAKSGLLFVAVVCVLSAWWISFLFGWPVAIHPKDIRDVFLSTGLVALVAFSGGLWTTLLLRQVAVAFWFTLLVPTGILLGCVNLLAEKHPHLFTPVLVTALILYSFAGFIYARWLFLRAQDVQWTGTTIALPKWRILPTLLVGSGAKRKRRPRAAMSAREFQLHQSQLIIAGALALLHLGVLGARMIGHGFMHHPTLEFVLGQFWYLWLVIPLLVGCAAVAEERKLGTLESELCLPARRRTQFATKLKVVLLLSVLLGAVMPLLLEGTKILPNIHLGTGSSQNAEVLGVSYYWLESILDLLRIPIFVSICAGVGAISFYFSTLSRHTLQALGPAILGIFAGVFLLTVAFLPERLIDCVPWRGWLVYLIGVPTTTLTLAWLAYWNYRRVLVGWLAWRRNLVTLLAAFAFVIASTAALYHRAWELVTPFESKQHGPPRLAASPRLTLQSEIGSLAVGLPNGSVWLGDFAFLKPSMTEFLTSNWQYKEVPGGIQFLEGTNWGDVADCIFDTVGIQIDGSLWVSRKAMPRRFYLASGKSDAPPARPSPFVRVGNDRNWKSVISAGRNALLLKDDGTLWAWGNTKPNGASGWPGLIAQPMEQVGTNSNWASIQRISSWLCLRKKDGRAWSNIQSVHGADSDTSKVLGYDVTRAEYFDQHNWRGAAWAQAAKEVAGGFLVGVRDDGTFHVMAQWQPGGLLAAQDVQLGSETNWLGLAAVEDIVIALKTDGTLWRWHFSHDPVIRPESATAKRFGEHSDWVVITVVGGDAFVSLSADGGLWYWRFNPRQFYSGEWPVPPLIGVSRKPLRIAGIFDAED